MSCVSTLDFDRMEKTTSTAYLGFEDSRSTQKERKIRVLNNRTLKVTPIFDTYWKFAAKRQNIFLKRVFGSPPPWTDDTVLAHHRFTNPFRASDRVSQFLIKHVIYDGDQSPDEVFFRTLLFKLFNRIDTWKVAIKSLGSPRAKAFKSENLGRDFDRLFEQGVRLYSAAYIMPDPKFGHNRKHRNHLHLLKLMLQNETPKRVVDAKSLEDVYEILRGFSSIGSFLAFQLAIDINYSELVDFSEMDFVVAGPGAQNGIRRCFSDTAGLSDSDVIRAISDIRESEFERLGIDFPNLWGRDLQLVDLQNLFCEVDKYARVVHPTSSDISNRKRIKQKFRPSSEVLPQWYPPKWCLNVPSYLAEEPIQI